MTTKIICMPNSIKILRLYGVFPSKNKELQPDVLFYWKFYTLAVFTSLTLVGSTLHLIKTIQDEQYNYIELDIIYIVSFSTAYALIGSFVLKVKASAEMYSFLSDFNEFGKPTNFDENNKLFNTYSKYHYVYLETLIMTILFSSNIFHSQSCEIENELYNLKEVCGLFSYTWMPFDINYAPVKQIYLAVQLIGNHHIYMLAGLLAWQVFETTQHIIIRIRDVKSIFVEALEEGNGPERRKKFNFAVRYHNAILSLEDKLNDAFGIFMFTHMVLTAAVIGTGIYCFFRRKSLSSFLVCMGWFWGLMMDCFSGQRLQDEEQHGYSWTHRQELFPNKPDIFSKRKNLTYWRSEPANRTQTPSLGDLFNFGWLFCLHKSLELAVAIYNSSWHGFENELLRDVLFVLMRCGTPMKLRAGTFGVMDRKMFLTVMKATYSYITLMRSQKN